MTETRQRAIDIINVLPEQEVERFVNLYVQFEQSDSESVPSGEIDFSSYRVPTSRGERVEEYMKEMRDNDRL